MRSVINVLLVEEYPKETLWVTKVLSATNNQHFNVIRVTTLAAAEAFLNQDYVDIILLHLGPSHTQHVDMLRFIRQRSGNTAIIILAIEEDESLAIKMMQAGAQDYLIKSDRTDSRVLRAMMYGIERKKSEQALKVFSDIVESADEAIYVRTFDGIITHWNKAAERIFGYSASEVIDHNISILYWDKHSLDAAHRISSKIKYGESIIDYKAKCKGKNGDKINISFTLSPLRNAENQIIAMVALGRDISQQNKLDQMLAIEYRIFMALSGSTSIESAAYGFLKIICDRLHWSVGEFWLFDEKTDHMQRLSCWPTSEMDQGSTGPSRKLIQSFDQGIHAMIGKTHQIYISHDSHNPKTKGLKSVIGLPILCNNQFLGRAIFYSVNADIMDSRLLSMLRTISDAMGFFIKRKRLEHDFSYLSQYDFLTGLLNKVSMQRAFIDMAALSKKKKSLMALFFLNLDEFKKVNNTVSHALGDLVLKEVASRLRHTMRLNDMIGRIGGDEFIVIIPDIKNSIEAEVLAQNILQAIAKPYHFHHIEFFLTASLGVSMFPTDGDDFDTILNEADIAMSVAKKEGGNIFKLSNPALERELVHKVSLENALYTALTNDEFIIYYQPIIDVKTRKIICLEALIRWRHKTQGLLLPADFIFLAEEKHLIIQIGDWILNTVFDHMKGIQAYDKSMQIAVNVSASQLTALNFLDKITKTTQIHPELKTNVEFEITENILMDTMISNSNLVKAIRNLGIKISIDDFGMGYSSFSYLQNYVADIIKIDQSFVAALNKRGKANAIVKAMIAIAHNLGTLVVAEGVETKDQVDFLIENECDRLQGYFFSQPVPIEDICTLLKNGFKVDF